MKSDVKNLKLADRGRARVEWAAREMPVLASIREDFAKRKPLRNVKLGACLHVTAETANLMITLKAGGASLTLSASNPLSTQDEVAAALVQHYKIPVFAKRGENRKTYYEHLRSVLAARPVITMDDGADLVSLLHTEYEKHAKNIWGSSEETTTGVIRLKSLAKSGKLKFPVIAVNDSKVKYLFDNRYGTGQSTIDGILRATNILLAGKVFVIVGFGWVGRGIAVRARGMGAEVVVCEVDPVRALEARMEGYRVMSTHEAASVGNIFVTATGDINALGMDAFERMKDGAILANSGHFDVEIDVKSLRSMAKEIIEVRPNLQRFMLTPQKSVYLIGEGRLVNLSSAEGHPAAVMDMSFAAQAKAAEYIVKNRRKLKRQVYALPDEIDREIAGLKLAAMGIKIDELTSEQKKYLSSWEVGT
ncbi:MAG: Adenosylhomocysteinase [Parcubacteria group bacterium GW2011_GWA2_52_8]|nr:MAG: Adenosylhomocysteinase [Parcubacteria group bacterium GW2011_GWA2_52_8]